MVIGSVNTKKRVFIVAEIGNNHEGSISEARKLVRAAAEAGADAVKFQTIVPEKLISADQQDRLQQLKKYALSFPQFQELQREATRAGVLFLSTPFDLDSVEFLNDLVPAFKIASGDSNFLALLEGIAATGKPVMISTGLSNQAEKAGLREFFHSAWRSARQTDPGLALLHCVTEYPTPDERAGLRYLEALGRWKDVTVGYSDHTLGIEAAVLAVGMGARIIEKHFTLDKNKNTFRDHALSADPEEFKALVSRIRRAEAFLAPVQQQEAPAVMPAARRSAAAKHDFQVGHKIKKGDILWLRPGRGFSPESEAQLLGRALVRPVSMGHLFSQEDFQS